MQTFKEWMGDQPLLSARHKIFNKDQQTQNYIFSTYWTGREAMQNHIGLNPEEVDALFKSGAVTHTGGNGGYIINRDKLHSLNNSITPPPRPPMSKYRSDPFYGQIKNPGRPN